MTAVPLTDQQLRDRIAAAFERLDAHQWGYDHGFCEKYGVDPETDSFVDAAIAELQPELDRLRAERDGFADRVDTLTAVAKSNKLAHRIAVEECDRLTAELERLRTELTRRRADDLNIRGALAPADGPRNVPMALGDSVTPAVEWLTAELGRVRAELASTQAQRDDARERLANYGTPLRGPVAFPPPDGAFERQQAERDLLETGTVPERHKWAVGKVICPEGRKCPAGITAIFTPTKRGRLPIHRSCHEICPGSGQKATPLKFAAAAVPSA